MRIRGREAAALLGALVSGPGCFQNFSNIYGSHNNVWQNSGSVTAPQPLEPAGESPELVGARSGGWVSARALRAPLNIKISDCNLSGAFSSRADLRPRYAAMQTPEEPTEGDAVPRLTSTGEADVLRLQLDGESYAMLNAASREHYTIQATIGPHHLRVSRLGCADEVANFEVRPGSNEADVKLEPSLGRKIRIFLDPKMPPVMIGGTFAQIRPGASFAEDGRRLALNDGAAMFGLAFSYAAAISFIDLGVLDVKVLGARDPGFTDTSNGSRNGADLYYASLTPSLGARLPLGFIAPRIGIKGGFGGFWGSDLPQGGIKAVYDVYTGLDVAPFCGQPAFRFEGGYSGLGAPSTEVPGFFHASARIAFAFGDLAKMISEDCGSVKVNEPPRENQ